MSPTWSFKKDPQPQEDATNRVLLNSPGDFEGLGLAVIRSLPTWLSLCRYRKEQLPLAACSGPLLPTHPRSQYHGYALQLLSRIGHVFCSGSHWWLDLCPV